MPFSNRVTMALVPQLLFIILIGTMSAEVQFSTHLNDESDTPNFQERSALCFQVPSCDVREREQSARVFAITKFTRN